MVALRNPSSHDYGAGGYFRNTSEVTDLRHISLTLEPAKVLEPAKALMPPCVLELADAEGDKAHNYGEGNYIHDAVGYVQEGLLT